MASENCISLSYRNCSVPLCDICSKKFKGKSYLLRHISEVHGGEKKNKCNFCDKNFTQSGSLKTHIQRTHEKLEKFKCAICAKNYSSKNAFNTHKCEYI